jgi:hypothetical protein
MEEVQTLISSSAYLADLFGDEMLGDDDFRATFGGFLLATHFSTGECAKQHGLLWDAVSLNRRRR